MSDIIKWSELRSIKKNALIAEYVMGWKWINFDYHDVTSIEHQLWLLPDAMATSEISPGEWTWYDEDEQGLPIGNRIVPYWVPEYVQSMDAAILVIRRFTVPVLLEWRGASFMCKIAAVFAKDEPSYGLSDNPAEAVCIAALKSKELEIRQ